MDVLVPRERPREGRELNSELERKKEKRIE